MIFPVQELHMDAYSTMQHVNMKMKFFVKSCIRDEPSVLLFGGVIEIIN